MNVLVLNAGSSSLKFQIIATDLEPKELAPGLTLPELQTKLTGKTKGAAGLVGLFVKPQ